MVNIKKFIIVTLITCLTISCIKKEQKQNIEGQIIELINQNKIDEALLKIDEQLKIKKTDDLLYLKASSLSMKAGIDIYALFPLLKIKIFDFAISQWSQNREFQKKAMAQKMSIGISNEDIDDKINSDLNNSENYVPVDKDSIKYLIEGQYLQETYSKDKLFCTVELIVNRTDIIKEMYAYNIVKIDSEDECLKIQAGSKLNISPETEDKIRESLVVEDYRQWFIRKKDQNRKSSYLKLMGTFSTLIDMIPMISKIPKINISGFSNLDEAQAIPSDIRSRLKNTEDELSEKVRKQLMMISALKIVSHIKNAFDFDKIKSPMDFICASNDEAAEEIIATQKDVLYLVNTINDQELINKNKELFEELKIKFEKLLNLENKNPELKFLRIKKLSEEFLRSKIENCE